LSQYEEALSDRVEIECAGIGNHDARRARGDTAGCIHIHAHDRHARIIGVYHGAMRLLPALLGVAFTVGLVHASEDWTRFRGPNGLGISDAKNVPVDFGPDKHVAWKTVLPPGHSSPVFTPTHIFLTAHSPERDAYELFVIALDRRSGKQLWQKEIPRLHPGRRELVNGPASPSPVTDGRNVYAFFQEFGLIALTADGQERWRLPLGPFTMFYGFGASPILVDETLILPIDQDQTAYMLALDAATGRERWKVNRPHVISGYSTPTIYRPPTGGTQIIVPESFQLTAYAVADGQKVWWVRGLACEMKSVASTDGKTLYINGWGFSQNQPGRQIPTVSFDEGLKLYDSNGDRLIGRDEITGSGPMDRMLRPEVGFDAFDGNRDGKLTSQEWDVFRAMLAAENGLLAIRMGGKGDMTDSAILWKYTRPVPQVPSTLLYQGVLFMVNDSGILISFDPETGKVLKQGRLQGAIDKYFASPVGADGKVWLVSQDGTVSVVTAKGEWETVAVNALDDEVFATPVPADGQLFVRTRSALYAFGRR
jgi:outer membrane protein assembly factor BamB